MCCHASRCGPELVTNSSVSCGAPVPTRLRSPSGAGQCDEAASQSHTRAEHQDGGIRQAALVVWLTAPRWPSTVGHLHVLFPIRPRRLSPCPRRRGLRAAARGCPRVVPRPRFPSVPERARHRAPPVRRQPRVRPLPRPFRRGRPTRCRSTGHETRSETVRSHSLTFCFRRNVDRKSPPPYVGRHADAHRSARTDQTHA